MLGGSFLLGGPAHHVQEYNRSNARLQASLLFLATVALLVPSAVSVADAAPPAVFTQTLNFGLAVLLIAACVMGLVFSLGMHREFFGSASDGEPGAGEIISAFAAARRNRLDLSVGIALGSAAQIAPFVAPVLVLASYFIGPTPRDLQLWPGAIVMMLVATMTAVLVTNSGRCAWFIGVLVLMVHAIFAITLYLLPPRVA